MDIFDIITMAIMWNAFEEAKETNEKKETKAVHKTEPKEPKNVNAVDISKKNDAVNHPSHYTDGKYEVIDFIEQWGLPYHLGNAVKYICRAGKKDPDKYVEDLEKALWYIHRWNSKENSEDYAYRKLSIRRNDKKIKHSEFVKDKGLPPQLGHVIFGCISYDDLNGSIKRAERILRKYIEDMKLERAYIKMKKEQANDVLTEFEHV